MDMQQYNAMSEQLTSGQQSAVNIGTLVLCVLTLIAMWNIFSKAGQAGWKVLIPIYNTYTFCKIVDGNGWKFLLLLIPFVNAVYAIILIFRLAKSFGKGFLFGLGLLFLSTLFTLILGFGSSTYIGPRGVPAVR